MEEWTFLWNDMKSLTNLRAGRGAFCRVAVAALMVTIPRASGKSAKVISTGRMSLSSSVDVSCSITSRIEIGLTDAQTAARSR